jgi:hypothetical protein
VFPDYRVRTHLQYVYIRDSYSTVSLRVIAAYIDPSLSNHNSLLDRGVKALIYVDTYDWICNWVGNGRWTLALEWSGKNGFVNQALRSWNIDGKKVGSVRNSGPVDGAGHMVRSFCSLFKVRRMFDAFHRFHMISLSSWRLQGDGWMASNSRGTIDTLLNICGPLDGMSYVSFDKWQLRICKVCCG